MGSLDLEKMEESQRIWGLNVCVACVCVCLKPTMHEATFVAGNTATLSFVGVAHGNIECYTLQVA